MHYYDTETVSDESKALIILSASQSMWACVMIRDGHFDKKNTLIAGRNYLIFFSDVH